MSDRLSELRRQRDLAQQQVEWFNREIARVSGETPSAAALPAPVAPPVPVPVPRPVLPAGEADPDLILDRYREKQLDVKADVRRGCFLYFFSAFALLGAGVAAWYLIRRH